MSESRRQRSDKKAVAAVSSFFERSFWLEVSILVCVICLLLLMRSQMHLVANSIGQHINYWQGLSLQERVQWQQRLQNLMLGLLMQKNQSVENLNQQIVSTLQAQLDQEKAENELLRASLGLAVAQSSVKSEISAPVLSIAQKLIEFPQAYQPSPQQIVMSSQGMLGWIDQVSGQRAHVLLLSENPTLRLAVTTQKGASGLLVNKRGTLFLTEVPTSSPLQKGDVVVTLNQVVVPGGLPIGVLGQVTTDTSGATQEAVVQPSINFGKEAIVTIRE